ncbi:exonuclease V, chloroplastic isoform X2 [Cryptomeria japonica]|uniref:exonuclease V, chloroplastic isoform X2 n=1 Tax=Cryptomeria japonica TaxID=3369 RepID=UPI0027DAB2CF|nr:exonuclease V, chloroplastic isoform X2 [Cryptomeria japonica]
MDIPVEIVSDEEMAFIEAALSLCSPPLMAEEKIASDSEDIQMEIEESPLQRHRVHQRRALSVTDITSTEWCEKQMEFSLIHGRPEKTTAMRAGSARHTELEAEVLIRMELAVHTREDSWAVKLLNFITGANQLLFDGLTRELPIIGLVEGVWLIGVIDEVRMCELSGIKQPIMVDTKTRSQAALPSEPQKRNGRLQLMCYKFLWDNIVTEDFPSSSFFQYFGLHPQRILSKDIRKHIGDSGMGKNVQSLDDLVKFYKRTCKSLPSAHKSLLIRYELQADRSLLAEDDFLFEATSFENQLHLNLQYWLGQRAATFVAWDENWKCNYCSFSNVCPRVQILSQEKK